MGKIEIKKDDPFEINVGKMHYRELNEMINRKILEGKRSFLLRNVIGQRYIGAGLCRGVEIRIEGIAGQDLGVFNGGGKIFVNGNAQDGVGNTMNDGFIAVNGNVGDIPGHMMRNGRLYVRGSAGYRTGIMMKEFGDKSPVIIVGEVLGDYTGEYMAGGTIIVLGYSLKPGQSPVSGYVASGIFGGQILIRGSLSRAQLGEGAYAEKAQESVLNSLLHYIEEFSELFDLDIQRILDSDFWIVRKRAKRPYKSLYVSSNKTGGEFVPVHVNSKAPCTNACPIEIPNPVIFNFLKDGKLDKAFEITDSYTPFRSTICGYLCPGFCMDSCSRKELDGAVNIREIARTFYTTKAIGRSEETGLSAGIIGAGPAGLSAAWHLYRKGFEVDVYEKDPSIGGKLVYNIPDDRVPLDVLERELNRIKATGINFYTGVNVDDEKFKEIRDSHNFTVVATGRTKPRDIGFIGEELAVSSYDFLKSVKTGGMDVQIDGKRVLVIGAGNVGVDVVDECLKKGAEKVTVIDIKTPSAFISDIERLQKRGVVFDFPKYLMAYENGRVYFTDGTYERADILIKAVGEGPNLDFSDLDIYADRESASANLKNVFVIGDCLKPGYLAHAVSSGKKVTDTIYSRVMGITMDAAEGHVVEKSRINTVYFQKRSILTPEISLCFSCGNCIQCDLCVENCPRKAIKRIDKNFEIDYEICAGCGVCASLCPRGAIYLVPRSKVLEEERTERSTITPQTDSFNYKIGKYT